MPTTMASRKSSSVRRPAGTHCRARTRMATASPDSLDLDSDNDGISDSREGRGDSDHDGIPDSLDAPGHLETAVRGAGAFDPLTARWLVRRARSGAAAPRRPRAHACRPCSPRRRCLRIPVHAARGRTDQRRLVRGARRRPLAPRAAQSRWRLQGRRRPEHGFSRQRGLCLVGALERRGVLRRWRQGRHLLRQPECRPPRRHRLQDAGCRRRVVAARPGPQCEILPAGEVRRRCRSTTAAARPRSCTKNSTTWASISAAAAACASARAGSRRPKSSATTRTSCSSRSESANTGNTQERTGAGPGGSAPFSLLAMSPKTDSWICVSNGVFLCAKCLRRTSLDAFRKRLTSQLMSVGADKP